MAKTVFLDKDFICHLDFAHDRIPYQTDALDDKCDAYIKACRLVPEGMSWVRDDGVEFKGLMVSPAVPNSSAESKQEQFNEDLKNMVLLDDVSELVEMVYQDDMGVIEE